MLKAKDAEEANEKAEETLLDHNNLLLNDKIVQGSPRTCSLSPSLANRNSEGSLQLERQLKSF